MSVRRIDAGGAVVRLGSGDSVAFSPDATRVLADALTVPRHVVVYPVGVGEPQSLPLGPLQSAAGRLWFPDGRRVVICGNERGRPIRCYEQDLMGGVPKPIAPEQFVVDAMASDGMTFALTGADRLKYVLRLGDNTPRPIPGTTAQDAVIAWSLDGRSVFVQERPAISVRLERVEVATGRRSIVVNTSLPDKTGLLRVNITSVSRDGESYTYSYWKRIARLFVVKETVP